MPTPVRAATASNVATARIDVKSRPLALDDPFEAQVAGAEVFVQLLQHLGAGRELRATDSIDSLTAASCRPTTSSRVSTASSVRPVRASASVSRSSRRRRGPADGPGARPAIGCAERLDLHLGLPLHRLALGRDLLAERFGLVLQAERQCSRPAAGATGRRTSSSCERRLPLHVGVDAAHELRHVRQALLDPLDVRLAAAPPAEDSRRPAVGRLGCGEQRVLRPAGVFVGVGVV